MTRFPDNEPFVSIVMTLMYTQGRALESIASWTTAQTLPRTQIELIVVSNGSDLVLEEKIRHLWNDGDRLLRVNSENEMELIDIGARQARAPWILITEPHVIADQHCLATLIDYLEKTGFDGACVRTLPSPQANWVEYVEDRMYREDCAVWSRDGDWRKFTKRGTIIRRTAYEAVNGLDYVYLRYSELTLAAKLHMQGFRLGFAGDAVVTHVNTTELKELLDYVWEFRQQERKFIKDHPTLMQGRSNSLCDPVDSLVRTAMFVCLCRALYYAVSRIGTTGGANFAITMLNAIVAYTCERRCGRFFACLRARLAYRSARLQLAFAWRSGDDRFHAFMKVWQLLGDFAAQVSPVRDDERRLVPVVGSSRPGELNAEHLVGFYSREQWNGQSFRWTGPIACMAFDVVPGDYLVTLDTRSLRTPSDNEMQLFWNGFAAARDNVLSKNGLICFRIEPSYFISTGPQLLTLTCSRLHSNSREVRELGLPLFAIELARNSVHQPVVPLTMNRTPRLAMAMCVRNEERFLAANLHYHHTLGVERAYVYLHGCTDRSLEIVRSFPWAVPIVIAEEQARRFGQMSDLQRTCMDEALSRTREEGYEWLLVLDADEFAFAENDVGDSVPTTASRGNLPRMLATLEPTVEMVKLRTAELVSQYMSEEEGFWKQKYFQDDNVLCRTIVDPLSGDTEVWNKFLGDWQGKSIVRTTAIVQAFNAHEWVRDQGKKYPTQAAHVPISTVTLGRRYHFLVVNCQHFKEKYMKLAWEPDFWHSGIAVEFPKRCWKQASTKLSISEIKNYLLAHFFLPVETLEAYAEAGKLRRDEAVANVLEESGYFERSPATTAEATFTKELSTAQLEFAEPFELLPHGKTYYDASDWLAGTYSGFYGVELHKGKYFRWSTPEAQIVLNFPPQSQTVGLQTVGRRRYRVGVELGPLRNLVKPFDINFVFCNKPIPAQDIRLEGTLLSFEIGVAQCDSTCEQKLGIRCSALDTERWESPDPRLLGVAIFGIYLECLSDDGFSEDDKNQAKSSHYGLAFKATVP